MRKLGICAMVGAIAAGVAVGGNPAHPASCWDSLSRAEKKWDSMRARPNLPPEFERRVTRILTQAAELRHQGRPERCLREVERAVREMNAGASKPAPRSRRPGSTPSPG